MTNVTHILSAIEQGNARAAEQLLPLVYEELRKLAAQKLAQERPGQTLQATALVHEAYLRLVDSEEARHWNSRGHFFAAAAEAMRRILIDGARCKRADKRGGGGNRIDLEQAEDVASAAPGDLLDLDEALDRLTRHDALSGQLVKLHYFAGLTVEQAAEVLGLSRATAYRQMTFARAWLRCQMSGEGAAEAGEDAPGEKSSRI
jgi:RNA polymerase sigma factor (TIGR02999 family)